MSRLFFLGFTSAQCLTISPLSLSLKFIILCSTFTISHVILFHSPSTWAELLYLAIIFLNTAVDYIQLILLQLSYALILHILQSLFISSVLPFVHQDHVSVPCLLHFVHEHHTMYFSQKLVQSASALF